MTIPTLLRNYRAVRDLVGDIHQTATAVDEQLGRFQIYGSAEELALAIAQAEALAAQAEQLKSELRLCARPAEHMQSSVRTGQPVPNPLRIERSVMRRIMARSAASVLFVMASLGVHSTEAASPYEQLIGAPVYAADGVEVGRVADVSITGNQIDALRVSRGAPLGLGERFVVIPRPAFMIRGRRVILPDLRGEDAGLFPDATSLASEDRTEDR